MKHLTVVALALENDAGEILIVQRPETTYYPFYWEFPGGKIEPNETPEQALCREISEEINLTINPSDLTPLRFATHLYPHAHVTILLFSCKKWAGEIQLKEGQPAYQWVKANKIKDLKMPEGNYKILDVFC
ncbi:MAG: (deoxy)nucleoside triphosphate pyrophosphohydrolase [Candidatus Paracaedibacteraceae bacterium]|nr:(deoxy)nucleoside triphosphate pyrophosphohydrolase [Candidatus Paracaedibacteraceae bacterium]